MSRASGVTRLLSRVTALAILVLPLMAAAPQGDLPSWVSALITKLEREPVASPPAYIARFLYRGDTVYYLPSRCCDVPSTVFNTVGAVICSADGGYTGGGDGRCADFFQGRRDEKIVWRDPRSRRHSY